MYDLRIRRQAQIELAQLPSGIYEKVRDTVRMLANQPRPAECRKLKGREGWRIRAGNYWLIYEIDDQQSTVMVLHIGHRRDVYR